MSALLYIPWFRPEPLKIPLPFGELPIQPFGVLVATGVLLGARLAERVAVRMGISPRVIADLSLHIIFSGFIFGHILDAIAYYPDRVMREPWFLLQIWNGLSSFGGFCGAIIGAVIWRVRRKMSLVAIADPAAFAFPLGWMFGRMGCFVVHDHPGRETDFFMAVNNYRVGVPPFEPRHDLGLYEVIWSACAFSLFLLLGRTKRKRGFFVALLPLLYTPVRFCLDFLRATPVNGGDIRYFGLTPGHYASVVLFVVGAVVMWKVQKGHFVLPAEASFVSTPAPNHTEGHSAKPGTRRRRKGKA